MPKAWPGTKKKSNFRPKGHPLLEWHIDDQAGILVIESMGPDYANGSTLEHEVCFHNELDAIRQLHHLISILDHRAYEKNPDLCDVKFGGCGKPLPYDKDEDWTCPHCQNINMGA